MKIRSTQITENAERRRQTYKKGRTKDERLTAYVTPSIDDTSSRG